MNKKTTLILIALLGAVVLASAQVPVPNVQPKRTRAITLFWDASPTPGITYVLRRGIAPGKYDEMVGLPATPLTYTWTNAPIDRTNYFVITAKLSGVTNGVAWEEESAYSNEVASDPRKSPEPPALRAAVPVTVEIFRGAPGGLQAQVLKVGPFYDEANSQSEVYSAKVHIGKPVQLLPE